MADPDRLLEGEDSSTPNPEEAQHWIDVYTDLMTFKERTESSAQKSLKQMPEPEARAEVARTDLPALKAERERLRRRLDFWKQRHADLTSQ
jgi:hypothetical protein